MSQTSVKVATHDPVWTTIRSAAEELAKTEPVLSSLLYATVLNQHRLEDSLAYHLSQRLGTLEVPALLVQQVFEAAYDADPEIAAAARCDIVAVYDRDPACSSYLEPLLYFKGFHALQGYRIAHWLIGQGRRGLALYLQDRISEVFGVDINPLAKVGRGIMIDHGTGVVIGETAVVEDGVSLLQGVTLGGTGKETGDRHPKIRKGSLIGANATILGNIEVGECARIGAGSVVLADVPAHCTAAGVPAQIVGCAGSDEPGRDMKQQFTEKSQDPSDQA
ncbi:MAG TPA: serine O-acetyltransferase [Alphaproteobacteria bacterium]|jgi:serine O-acetyltransferase|nr:serine O-acetyltransferase [Alphaproteobacteria bacterium]HBA42581.1 serine O-acetyltransferase [Alphaproteobacteria bacterium]HBF99120.1 serine O-acetyltransferase [Alphaproteobacteria bacterium]